MSIHWLLPALSFSIQNRRNSGSALELLRFWTRYSPLGLFWKSNSLLYSWEWWSGEVNLEISCWIYPTLMQLELELFAKECFLLLLFKVFQNDVGLFMSPLDVLDRNSPFLSWINKISYLNISQCNVIFGNFYSDKQQ